MALTVFDYGVGVVFAVCILLGAFRGAVLEIFYLGAWVVAYFVATMFGRDVAAILPDALSDAAVRQVVGLVLAFLLALVGMNVLGNLFSVAIRKIGLASLDRVAGAAVGVVRGAVITLIVVIGAGLTKLPERPEWRDAASSRFFETLALAAKPFLPDSIANHLAYRRGNPNNRT